MTATFPLAGAIGVSTAVLDDLSRHAAQVRARSCDLCSAAARARERASGARFSSRPRHQYARLDGMVGGTRRSVVVYRDGTVRADPALRRRARLAVAVEAVFRPGDGGSDHGPLGLAMRLAQVYDDLWRFEILDVSPVPPVRAVVSPPLTTPLSPSPTETTSATVTPLTPPGGGPHVLDPGDLVTVTFEEGDDAPVVHVRGELDLLVAERVRWMLSASRASIVVADLSELSFLDAAGLRALCSAKGDARRRGIRLRLVGACGIVRRVFELCGLEAELDN